MNTYNIALLTLRIAVWNDRY